jgi:hypothetical protein
MRSFICVYFHASSPYPASDKASVFLFVVSVFSANKVTFQRRPEADVSHYVSVPSGFT